MSKLTGHLEEIRVSSRVVAEVADLEAENARLQEERGNLQRLNMQIHEVNEQHVLERDRYKALAEQLWDWMGRPDKDGETTFSVVAFKMKWKHDNEKVIADVARAALATTPEVT